MYDSSVINYPRMGLAPDPRHTAAVFYWPGSDSEHIK